MTVTIVDFEYRVDRLMEAAERRARSEQFVTGLAVQNRSTNLEEAIAQDISLQLARDSLHQANQEYQKLVSAMTAEELEEIAKRARTPSPSGLKPDEWA